MQSQELNPHLSGPPVPQIASSASTFPEASQVSQASPHLPEPGLGERTREVFLGPEVTRLKHLRC